MTLLALDLATKTIAWLALAPDVPVDSDRWFQIVLRYNEIGLGSQALDMGLHTYPDYLVQEAFAGWGLGISLLLLQKRPWSRLIKATLAAAAYLLSFVVGGAFVMLLPEFEIRSAVTLGKVGGATLFVALWWITPSRLWRIPFALLLVAAFGNLVSFFLPPFVVIDFMYSKLTSAVFGQGVFNAADLYYDAALVLLPLFALHWFSLRAAGKPEKARAPS